MQNDTQRIITYCRSTVNIAKASHWKCFYFYSREIELKKFQYVLLSIDPQQLSYFGYVLY